MQSTELSCPHCGSTLNFGLEILAGTPVECMICMQSFTAAPKPVAATAPVPAATRTPAAPPKAQAAAPVATSPIAAAKPAPRAPALVAAPHIAPPTAAIAAGEAPQSLPTLPKSEQANANASRSVAKPSDSFDPSKLILVAIAAGLFFILTGGIAFAIWKIASAVRTPTGDQLLANDEKSGKAKKTGANGEDPEGNPGGPGAEDPEWRKEKETILLARKKNLFNGGTDLNFDPVSTIKIPKMAIPGLDQAKINAAIEKGVIYLKKSQLPNGTWAGGHAVGHAAIGGLTMLECGVPANDFFVQRAAVHVRGGIANLNGTYELSLAVLFLDRLGDPRDRLAIQGMALRLLAGQNDGGGWGYNCPVLPPDQMYQLFAFLHSHKQPNMQNPLGANPNLQNPIQREGLNPDDPFLRLHEMMLGHDGNANPPKGGVIQPVNPKIPPVKLNPKGQPIAPNWLRAELQNLPVVQNQGKGKKGKGRPGGGGDNSNTQFAMLALWAARRHGVPTDQALIASYQRFESTQSADGGWGYHGAGTTPAMTGVGVLGEAMGHGAAPEVLAVNPKNPKQVLFKPVLEDPTIQKGLSCFAKFVGQPSMDPAKTAFPMENLYFLWTVERVAMLYDLKSFDGKDWYGWGAQILVHNQNAEGAWPSSNYPGAHPQVNTCFALLFLKRSNLVQDLTNNLRLHSAIPDAPK